MEKRSKENEEESDRNKFPTLPFWGGFFFE